MGATVPTEYDSRPETYAHIEAVRTLMLRAALELIRRAHEHDASKLVSPEVEVFDRVTPMLKTLVYDSPEYRASLEDMGPALAHHYAANRHHPEHFENGVADMTLVDLIEMTCDWMAAAGRTKDGDVLKSIRSINAARFGYAPGGELAAALENTALALEQPTDSLGGE
jgi:hypothetical protein